MAGYIMTLGNKAFEALKKCMETGIYSTNLNIPTGNSWNVAHEGTFADYLSMKPGDNIYFFTDRKIYGIGKITNVGEDCKYLNFKDADYPQSTRNKKYAELNPLLDETYSERNRCFCVFEPSPYFFMRGVEMDDALNSNPEKFKMLRAMWKVSFIKIDDEENKALFDIILKRNEENLINKSNIFTYSPETHMEIERKLQSYNRFKAYAILFNCVRNNAISHEMAIEAALCDLLSHSNHPIFGKKWDYISHQVVASPFKPVDYMDKMDIFGYRYIDGFDTISKYIIVEIKKDSAQPQVIDQVMKYVDWVTVEYAHGDYSMIEAYVVASDFSEDVLAEKEKDAIRGYVKGYRPAESCLWKNLKLVKYSYDDGQIIFDEVK